MQKGQIKYGFILLIALFCSQISYGQSFKGGNGDGYVGSSSTLVDLTTVPELISVTVNQSGSQADPTNTFDIIFDVVFNHSVNDFTFDDITWIGTAGSISGSITGSGTNYTIQVSSIGTEGTVIPIIEEGKVHDAFANYNSLSSSTDNEVTYDITRPGVEIVLETGQSDPTSVEPVSFRINFTEPVVDFISSDVSVAGSAGASTVVLTGGPSSYKADVTGMTNAGTIIINVGEGVASDMAGNTNTTSVNTQNTVYFDNIPPEVTINQTSSQTDPTNVLPVSFDVVFSEDVVDFTFDDITWNGTASGVSGTISGSGAVYTVEISSLGTEGTLIPIIEAGKVHDALANVNLVSTSTDNSVTYDITRPGIEIILEPGQENPTNNSIVSFRANFTEQVSGFVPSDVALSGTSGASSINLRGGPLSYTIDVSGMINDGTITVSIDEGLTTDAAGNTNTQSVNTQNSVSYDNTKPDVVISSTETSPTNLTQIPVVIEFSSEVSGFELNDINFSNCTISSLNETITNLRWEAVIEPNSNGTVVLQIAANMATDLAGNGNNASNNFSIDYERGNSAPLVDNQSFSVDESSANGTLVGQLVATDPENDGLSFSIVSGNLENTFALDSQTGDITVANQVALNYSTHPVFNLIVLVEDDYSSSLSTQADVEITVNEIDLDFEASNVFTPNSQQNRYWTIRHVERYADFELTIRNNTGRIVYQTKNYQNNWNGTCNNKSLPTGTYYYFLQKGAMLYKGFINIIQE